MNGAYDIIAVSEFITLQHTQLEVSVPELSLYVLSVKYGLDENYRNKWQFKTSRVISSFRCVLNEVLAVVGYCPALIGS